MSKKSKITAERLKQSKRLKILQVALAHFSKHNFEEVSLREIAAEIGISVGNLYNYFVNKDALFEAVLEPFLRKALIVKRFLSAHTEGEQEEMEKDFSLHLELSDKIAKFVHKNRQSISILLFHSKGSSLENFPDQMIDFQTERFQSEINAKVGSPVSDFFFAHNLVSYFYNTIREGLMHNLDLAEFQKAIRDMIIFSYLGVMGLAQKKLLQETDTPQN